MLIKELEMISLAIAW